MGSGGVGALGEDGHGDRAAPGAEVGEMGAVGQLADGDLHEALGIGTGNEASLPDGEDRAVEGGSPKDIGEGLTRRAAGEGFGEGRVIGGGIVTEKARSGKTRHVRKEQARLDVGFLDAGRREGGAQFGELHSASGVGSVDAAPASVGASGTEASAAVSETGSRRAARSRSGKSSTRAYCRESRATSS